MEIDGVAGAAITAVQHAQHALWQRSDIAVASATPPVRGATIPPLEITTVGSTPAFQRGGAAPGRFGNTLVTRNRMFLVPLRRRSMSLLPQLECRWARLRSACDKSTTLACERCASSARTPAV